MPLRTPGGNCAGGEGSGTGSSGGKGPRTPALRAVCAAPWCPLRLAEKIEVSSEQGTEWEPSGGRQRAGGGSSGRQGREGSSKKQPGKGACGLTSPRRAAERLAARE